MTRTEMILEAVSHDTSGMVGPVYRVDPAGTLTVTPPRETVAVDHWSGEYVVVRRDGGRVYLTGPGLVASVPASHLRPITTPKEK